MNQPPARSPGFDPSNISRGAWVSLGGAVVLLISVFLDWYSGTVSVSGVNIPGFSGSASKSVSGVDATDVAWIVFLLAAIALIAWGLELFAEGVTVPYPAWLIAGICGVLSAVLVLFRIVDKPGGLGTTGGGSFNFGKGKISWSVGTSFGIWLALLAAIAMAVGAYLMLNEQNAAATGDADAEPSPPSPPAYTAMPPSPVDTAPPPASPADAPPPAAEPDAPPAAEPDAPPAEGTSSD